MERIMIPAEPEPGVVAYHAHHQNHRSRSPGRHQDPFGPKMFFNYPERTEVLPYRDTELQSPPDHLTNSSLSGTREARRRLAAYPAVHSASTAMIAVSATNAPLLPASPPRP